MLDAPARHRKPARLIDRPRLPVAPTTNLQHLAGRRAAIEATLMLIGEHEAQIRSLREQVYYLSGGVEER